MKLSVALCTYNGEQFLKEQMDSILKQQLPVHEIVICDDGSTDNTIAMIEQYMEEHPGIIKLHQNEINLRSVKNFEKAIGLCTGDVIFLSDQDDIWTLDKTEDYVKFLNENPNIQVVASNGYCIDESSVVHEKYSLWDIPHFLLESGGDVEYFKIITYFSNIVTGASVAIRKEYVSAVIPFPVIKDFHHDEWIALVAASEHKLKLLNGKYFYYRIHENQQVGGVFFDKTEKMRQFLTRNFNLHPDNTSFYFLKRRAKKLSHAYKKNQKFIVIDNKYSDLFQTNIEEIKRLYYDTLVEMKQKYPVKTFLLSIVDKIKGKRQLKE